jgi:hypothetical protein
MQGLHDFILSTVILRLAMLGQKDLEVAVAAAACTTGKITQPVSAEDNQPEVANELFIHAQGLEPMSFTTAWRSMRLLGFRYDT